MKPVGVVRFPGTNCDQDVFNWAAELNGNPQWIDGNEHFDIDAFSAILLPGGFSYGDYLRCGALAARSPAMQDVKRFASNGGFVLGICNGFQILCESGLLPGALLQNDHGKFRDDMVTLNTENEFAAFPELKKAMKVTIPIAHGEGRFVADPAVIKQLHEKKQVWLTYDSNPNGSVDNIAGVCNENKNVFGLMPHPDRAFQPWMETQDGRFFLWKNNSKNID